MSVPDDDLGERGRAIFERLREPGEPDLTADAGVAGDTGAEVGAAAGPAPVPTDDDVPRSPSATDEASGSPAGSATPPTGATGPAVAGGAAEVAPTGEPPGEPSNADTGGDPGADRPAAPGPGVGGEGHRVPDPPLAGDAAPEPGMVSEPAVAAEAPAASETEAVGAQPEAQDRPEAQDHRAAQGAVARPSSGSTPTTAPEGRAGPHSGPAGVPGDGSEVWGPRSAVEEQVVEATTPTSSRGDGSSTRFVRPLPRVLAIANQKGGVGKTTTAVNLGAGLAELGYRVLVVDLDPQGNATTGLGINPRNVVSSVYEVIMHDTPLEDCIEPTTLRGLFVCPATIDLAGAEIELVPAFSRELKLRRALEPALEDFDFVLIDCPPSLGLITVNGLAAASEVVVPIQCEYYALEGLGQLLRNVNLVQTNLNPRLEVSAIVLTMYDARTKLADQVASEVRSHFGDKVCRNIVPRTVRLSEAPSFGQPIIVFDPMSRGAIAYRGLAKEVSGGAPQRVG